MIEPLLEPETLKAVMAVIDRLETSIRAACLMQSDTDPKAKTIEWYRGGAQVLVGLRGELESEKQRREASRVEEPEKIIEDNLEVLRRTGNWEMRAPPDPDAEL